MSLLDDSKIERFLCNIFSDNFVCKKASHKNLIFRFSVKKKNICLVGHARQYGAKVSTKLNLLIN